MEVEIKNLKKVYGEFTAVDGPLSVFSFGSVTAVVGPNGAGKSTLLSLIAGLPEKSGGQILYDGDETPPLRQMTMGVSGTLSYLFHRREKYRVSVENKGNAEGRDMPESGEAGG